MKGVMTTTPLPTSIPHEAIYVVYGSTSGNAENIARSLHNQAISTEGFVDAKCLSLNEFAQQKILDAYLVDKSAVESNSMDEGLTHSASTTPPPSSSLVSSAPLPLCLLIVCSTTGEGEPPDNALRFRRYVRNLPKEKKLSGVPPEMLFPSPSAVSSSLLPSTSTAHATRITSKLGKDGSVLLPSSSSCSCSRPWVRYAVLALGDTNYNSFCAAGIWIDKQLDMLGATRFFPRGEADDAFDLATTVDPWVMGIWPRIHAARLLVEKGIEQRRNLFTHGGEGGAGGGKKVEEETTTTTATIENNHLERVMIMQLALRKYRGLGKLFSEQVGPSPFSAANDPRFLPLPSLEGKEEEEEEMVEEEERKSEDKEEGKGRGDGDGNVSGLGGAGIAERQDVDNASTTSATTLITRNKDESERYYYFHEEEEEEEEEEKVAEEDSHPNLGEICIVYSDSCNICSSIALFLFERVFQWGGGGGGEGGVKASLHPIASFNPSLPPPVLVHTTPPLSATATTIIRNNSGENGASSGGGGGGENVAEMSPKHVEMMSDHPHSPPPPPPLTTTGNTMMSNPYHHGGGGDLPSSRGGSGSGFADRTTAPPRMRAQPPSTIVWILTMDQEEHHLEVEEQEEVMSHNIHHLNPASPSPDLSIPLPNFSSSRSLLSTSASSTPPPRPSLPLSSLGAFGPVFFPPGACCSSLSLCVASPVSVFYSPPPAPTTMNHASFSLSSGSGVAMIKAKKRMGGGGGKPTTSTTTTSTSSTNPSAGPGAGESGGNVVGSGEYSAFPSSTRTELSWSSFSPPPPSADFPSLFEKEREGEKMRGGGNHMTTPTTARNTSSVEKSEEENRNRKEKGKTRSPCAGVKRWLSQPGIQYFASLCVVVGGKVESAPRATSLSQSIQRVASECQISPLSTLPPYPHSPISWMTKKREHETRGREGREEDQISRGRHPSTLFSSSALPPSPSSAIALDEADAFLWVEYLLSRLPLRKTGVKRSTRRGQVKDGVGGRRRTTSPNGNHSDNGGGGGGGKDNEYGRREASTSLLSSSPPPPLWHISSRAVASLRVLFHRRVGDAFTSAASEVIQTNALLCLRKWKKGKKKGEEVEEEMLGRTGGTFSSLLPSSTLSAFPPLSSSPAIPNTITEGNNNNVCLEKSAFVTDSHSLQAPTAVAATDTFATAGGVGMGNAFSSSLPLLIPPSSAGLIGDAVSLSGLLSPLVIFYSDSATPDEDGYPSLPPDHHHENHSASAGVGHHPHINNNNNNKKSVIPPLALELQRRATSRHLLRSCLTDINHFRSTGFPRRGIFIFVISSSLATKGMSRLLRELRRLKKHQQQQLCEAREKEDVEQKKKTKEAGEKMNATITSTTSVSSPFKGVLFCILGIDEEERDENEVVGMMTMNGLGNEERHSEEKKETERKAKREGKMAAALLPSPPPPPLGKSSRCTSRSFPGEEGEKTELRRKKTGGGKQQEGKGMHAFALELEAALLALQAEKIHCTGLVSMKRRGKWGIKTSVSSISASERKMEEGRGSEKLLASLPSSSSRRCTNSSPDENEVWMNNVILLWEANLWEAILHPSPSLAYLDEHSPCFGSGGGGGHTAAPAPPPPPLRWREEEDVHNKNRAAKEKMIADGHERVRKEEASPHRREQDGKREAHPPHHLVLQEGKTSTATSSLSLPLQLPALSGRGERRKGAECSAGVEQLHLTPLSTTEILSNPMTGSFHLPETSTSLSPLTPSTRMKMKGHHTHPPQQAQEQEQLQPDKGEKEEEKTHKGKTPFTRATSSILQPSESTSGAFYFPPPPSGSPSPSSSSSSFFPPPPPPPPLQLAAPLDSPPLHRENISSTPILILFASPGMSRIMASFAYRLSMDLGFPTTLSSLKKLSLQALLSGGPHRNIIVVCEEGATPPFPFPVSASSSCLNTHLEGPNHDHPHRLGHENCPCAHHHFLHSRVEETRRRRALPLQVTDKEEEDVNKKKTRKYIKRREEGEQQTYHHDQQEWWRQEEKKEGKKDGVDVQKPWASWWGEEYEGIPPPPIPPAASSSSFSSFAVRPSPWMSRGHSSEECTSYYPTSSSPLRLSSSSCSFSSSSFSSFSSSSSPQFSFSATLWNILTESSWGSRYPILKEALEHLDHLPSNALSHVRFAVLRVGTAATAVGGEGSAGFSTSFSSLLSPIARRSTTTRPTTWKSGTSESGGDEDGGREKSMNTLIVNARLEELWSTFFLQCGAEEVYPSGEMRSMSLVHCEGLPWVECVLASFSAPASEPARRGQSHSSLHSLRGSRSGNTSPTYPHRGSTGTTVMVMTEASNSSRKDTSPSRHLQGRLQVGNHRYEDDYEGEGEGTELQPPKSRTPGLALSPYSRFSSSSFPPSTPASVFSPVAVTFLYGSSTGKSESIARDFHWDCHRRGISSVVAPLQKFSSVGLFSTALVVIICSTCCYNRGGYPDNAKRFSQFIHHKEHQYHHHSHSPPPPRHASPGTNTASFSCSPYSSSGSSGRGGRRDAYRLPLPPPFSSSSSSFSSCNEKDDVTPPHSRIHPEEGKNSSSNRRCSGSMNGPSNRVNGGRPPQHPCAPPPPPPFPLFSPQATKGGSEVAEEERGSPTGDYPLYRHEEERTADPPRRAGEGRSRRVGGVVLGGHEEGSGGKLSVLFHGMRYAVLGVGNASVYPDTFCMAAANVDRQLERLGATRCCPFVRLDISSSSMIPQIQQWRGQLFGQIEHLVMGGGGGGVGVEVGGGGGVGGEHEQHPLPVLRRKRTTASRNTTTSISNLYTRESAKSSPSGSGVFPMGGQMHGAFHTKMMATMKGKTKNERRKDYPQQKENTGEETDGEGEVETVTAASLSHTSPYWEQVQGLVGDWKSRKQESRFSSSSLYSSLSSFSSSSSSSSSSSLTFSSFCSSLGCEKTTGRRKDEEGGKHHYEREGIEGFFYFPSSRPPPPPPPPPVYPSFSGRRILVLCTGGTEEVQAIICRRLVEHIKALFQPYATSPAPHPSFSSFSDTTQRTKLSSSHPSANEKEEEEERLYLFPSATPLLTTPMMSNEYIFPPRPSPPSSPPPPFPGSSSASSVASGSFSFPSVEVWNVGSFLQRKWRGVFHFIIFVVVVMDPASLAFSSSSFAAPPSFTTASTAPKSREKKPNKAGTEREEFPHEGEDEGEKTRTLSIPITANVIRTTTTVSSSFHPSPDYYPCFSPAEVMPPNAFHLYRTLQLSSMPRDFFAGVKFAVLVVRWPFPPLTRGSKQEREREGAGEELLHPPLSPLLVHDDDGQEEAEEKMVVVMKSEEGKGEEEVLGGSAGGKEEDASLPGGRRGKPPITPPPRGRRRRRRQHIKKNSHERRCSKDLEAENFFWMDECVWWGRYLDRRVLALGGKRFFHRGEVFTEEEMEGWMSGVGRAIFMNMEGGLPLTERGEGSGGGSRRTKTIPTTTTTAATMMTRRGKEKLLIPITPRYEEEEEEEAAMKIQKPKYQEEQKSEEHREERRKRDQQPQPLPQHREKRGWISDEGSSGRQLEDEKAEAKLAGATSALPFTTIHTKTTGSSCVSSSSSSFSSLAHTEAFPILVNNAAQVITSHRAEEETKKAEDEKKGEEKPEQGEAPGASLTYSLTLPPPPQNSPSPPPPPLLQSRPHILIEGGEPHNNATNPSRPLRAEVQVTRKNGMERPAMARSGEEDPQKRRKEEVEKDEEEGEDIVAITNTITASPLPSPSAPHLPPPQANAEAEDEEEGAAEMNHVWRCRIHSWRCLSLPFREPSPSPPRAPYHHSSSSSPNRKGKDPSQPPEDETKKNKTTTSGNLKTSFLVEEDEEDEEEEEDPEAGIVFQVNLQLPDHLFHSVDKSQEGGTREGSGGTGRTIAGRHSTPDNTLVNKIKKMATSTPTTSTAAATTSMTPHLTEGAAGAGADPSSSPSTTTSSCSPPSPPPWQWVPGQTVQLQPSNPAEEVEYLLQLFELPFHTRFETWPSCPSGATAAGAAAALPCSPPPQPPPSGSLYSSFSSASKSNSAFSSTTTHPPPPPPPSAAEAAGGENGGGGEASSSSILSSSLLLLASHSEHSSIPTPLRSGATTPPPPRASPYDPSLSSQGEEEEVPREARQWQTGATAAAPSSSSAPPALSPSPPAGAASEALFSPLSPHASPPSVAGSSFATTSLSPVALPSLFPSSPLYRVVRFPTTCGDVLERRVSLTLTRHDKPFFEMLLRWMTSSASFCAPFPQSPPLSPPSPSCLTTASSSTFPSPCSFSPFFASFVSTTTTATRAASHAVGMDECGGSGAAGGNHSSEKAEEDGKEWDKIIHTKRQHIREKIQKLWERLRRREIIAVSLSRVLRILLQPVRLGGGHEKKSKTEENNGDDDPAEGKNKRKRRKGEREKEREGEVFSLEEEEEGDKQRRYMPAMKKTCSFSSSSLFPVFSLPPFRHLVEHLSLLQPRVYSICSSAYMGYPPLLSLCVKVVPHGVCTHWLFHRCLYADGLPITNHHRRHHHHSSYSAPSLVSTPTFSTTSTSSSTSSSSSSCSNCTIADRGKGVLYLAKRQCIISLTLRPVSAFHLPVPTMMSPAARSISAGDRSEHFPSRIPPFPLITFPAGEDEAVAAPVILIAAGTGVGPFRAYLQERHVARCRYLIERQKEARSKGMKEEGDGGEEEEEERGGSEGSRGFEMTDADPFLNSATTTSSRTSTMFISDKLSQKGEGHFPNTTNINTSTGTVVVKPHRNAIQEVFGEVELFFGCRRRWEDFLFEEEWSTLERNGDLTSMQVCFSREQNDGHYWYGGCYVQDQLIASGFELCERLLVQKAKVYLCGDTGEMGKGVYRAFIEILKMHRRCTEQQAREYMKELVQSGRYITDVWGH